MSSNSFFPTGAKLDSGATSSLPSTILVGNRFYSDQPIIELLSEFLLIVQAEKTVNEFEKTDDYFLEHRHGSEIESLKYTINHRLNFKLFSLWNTGKTTKVSDGHYNRYLDIRKHLASAFDDELPSSIEKHMDILANLYQGFQTSGAERDWCARSFLPISSRMLMGETVWKATAAKKIEHIDDFEKNKEFLQHSSRNFYARGGEILYLQLLSFFTKTKEDVDDLLATDKHFAGLRILSENEKDPKYLRNDLIRGFHSFFDNSELPKSFENFMDFIEDFYKAEEDSFDASSGKNFYNITRGQRIGLIPDNSWYLGFLFALELSRLFKSQFGQIDLIKLLSLECAFQCLRTYVFQSSRELGVVAPTMAIVSPYCVDAELKSASARSFVNCRSVIMQAFEKLANEDPRIIAASLKEGDRKKMHDKSGFKLFTKYGKQIGLVIPRTGANEHFVLSKDMLILLVSTTLVPGESLTFDSFLEDLKIRYGFVFNEDEFTAANVYAGCNKKIINPDICNWLISMLEDCGYYIPLSDALSLVKNTNLGVEV